MVTDACPPLGHRATMADQLYLSFWLRNFNQQTMFRHYEKLLRLFPYSRLAQQASTLKVIAVDYDQPTVFEIAFPPPVPIEQVLAAAKDFENSDSSYRLETWWDLWQFDTDWKLGAARVTLCCFGPEFGEDDHGHLGIEFGIDAHFLPQPQLPNSLRMIQSNIQSLLKLVHDLDDALPVETRRLWSESGENFSEKLHQALAEVQS
jgi:hypothetical protein